MIHHDIERKSRKVNFGAIAAPAVGDVIVDEDTGFEFSVLRMPILR